MLYSRIQFALVGLLIGACLSFPVTGLGEDVHLEFDPDGTSKVYSSPQSILSDFFGRRRSGLLVSGMEDLVGITATGISPMLVLSVTAPVVYVASEPEARGELMFLYQPWFFIPIILLTLLVLFKDTVLTFASYLKKPLDVLGILFNIVGFLLGFRLIYHLLDIQIGTETSAAGNLFNILILVGMLLFYCSIWLMSNFFEVLILINPFPTVDTLLRVGKISLLISMYIACWIHPALGAMLALPVLLVSIFMFERTLRTSLLGVRLIYDLALFRKDEITAETPLTAFSAFASGLPWLAQGRVTQEKDRSCFQFRRYSIGPRKSIPLPSGQYSIGKGSLFPMLVVEIDGKCSSILRFPASYRGQEEALAERFDASEIHDWRWSQQANSAWQWFYGLLFDRSRLKCEVEDSPKEELTPT